MGCDDGQFECVGYPYNCIALRRMCDGKGDCGVEDNSDENQSYCDIYKEDTELHTPLLIILVIIFVIGLVACCLVCYCACSSKRSSERGERQEQPMVVISGTNPTTVPNTQYRPVATNRSDNPYQPTTHAGGSRPRSSPYHSSRSLADTRSSPYHSRTEMGNINRSSPYHSRTELGEFRRGSSSRPSSRAPSPRDPPPDYDQFAPPSYNSVVSGLARRGSNQ